MNADVLHLIDSFKDLSVLVVGDALLDRYIDGRPDKLCREAPVPVLTGVRQTSIPGGAANTAANVASLSARVRFLSAVGRDPEGEELLRILGERGVDTAPVFVHPRRATNAKHRVTAEAQMMVRFDQGTNDDLDPAAENEILGRIERAFEGIDAVILSDYRAGFLTARVREAIADLHRRNRAVVLAADAKDLSLYREIAPAFVKPNYHEALALAGLSPVRHHAERPAQIIASEKALFERTGARIVAVTLDRDGAVILERGRTPYRTYARPRKNSSATGAGDTFTGAFTLALAAGADTTPAAELASAATAVVVEKRMTAACTRDELKGSLSLANKRIADRAALGMLLQVYRRRGRAVVFTNGCFDIIHRGHVTYLSHAKALGDVLIVGVNSDESVRRLKGPSRPINMLEDRLQVLAALSCVDHVVAFDDDTSAELIRAIRPSIYVKGGDYASKELPEAELVTALGGRIVFIPYIENVSTTGIIERASRGRNSSVRSGEGA